MSPASDRPPDFWYSTSRTPQREIERLRMSWVRLGVFPPTRGELAKLLSHSASTIDEVEMIAEDLAAVGQLTVEAMRDGLIDLARMRRRRDHGGR